MFQLFVDNIFKLHGIPATIVSDQNPTFTSKFWQEVFKLQGTQLKMSSVYYPQTNGQPEIVNKCLETYVHYFVSSQLVHWVRLPLAKWWHNTLYHITMQMIPYEALYVQASPIVKTYIPCSTKVQEVDTNLHTQVVILHLIQENLQTAQHHIKQ